VTLQQTVEQTVVGLGYDLVEIERCVGGLLRITIDMPWTPDTSVQYITVDDCEKVTRQLQFALEVEGVDYRRLEVSSPGIDRLLRSAQELERFVGEVLDITLRAPLGDAAGPHIAANRKKFRGALEKTPEGGWQIVWSNPQPKSKPGQRVGKNRPPQPLHALGFVWDELQEARLAPIINFKGRGKP